MRGRLYGKVEQAIVGEVISRTGIGEKYIMKKRKLKVYETEYQINNPNGFWYCRKKRVSIPQIRLQGKWLQECGFEPGSQVQIQCEQGKLIITLE